MERFYQLWEQIRYEILYEYPLGRGKREAVNNGRAAFFQYLMNQLFLDSQYFDMKLVYLDTTMVKHRSTDTRTCGQ